MFLAQFQKIERVFILHGKFGLRPLCGCQCLVKVGLSQQGFLVTLIFDLVDQHILGPAEFPGQANIEFALQRVLTAL